MQAQSGHTSQTGSAMERRLQTIDTAHGASALAGTDWWYSTTHIDDGTREAALDRSRSISSPLVWHNLTIVTVQLVDRRNLIVGFKGGRLGRFTCFSSGVALSRVARQFHCHLSLTTKAEHRSLPIGKWATSQLGYNATRNMLRVNSTLSLRVLGLARRTGIRYLRVHDCGQNLNLRPFGYRPGHSPVLDKTLQPDQCDASS